MSGLASSLGTATYLSLMTYRKDATGVATPVWVAQRGEFLFVWTQADSGKVKRINTDPVVQVAACTVSGKLKSGYFPATARVIDGGGESMVRELMGRKYGWQLKFLIWQQKVRKKSIDHVGIQITLGGEISGPAHLDD
ncbi:unannotated protein [freshwater metagenome]|uniref:Unannotated protein n=1 Tax=freshwater metagenome TaxID=449393 RepID=A0A6J7CLH4_9ZZZZ|nr:PPOX class F420-dependent oxidoreductase [Actinomycetota bacterium]